MYKNNNKTKYYIYNCVKEDYITTCDSFEELIEYVASFNYLPWWSSKKYCNRFLEDYNCTMNDTKVYCDWTDKAFKRTYVVFDNMFRIIDVRMYEKEILGYTPPKNRKRKWRKPIYKYYEKTRPEFRKGPVPHTGGRYGRYYRHPRTFNEIRQNSNPEYKDFVRGERKHLPTVWDDKVRGQSRCWKDQSKKRKQWM